MDKPLATPPEIDKLIHEPARLQIMANLYVVEEADFTYLMRQTGLTWGNLSSHLSKLEEASYIDVIKGYKGKRPHTMLRLTGKGRTAFETYRQQMLGMLAELPSGE
ncbi:MAG: transcriptional regulator [Anaerolineales bacterium]|nr:transcriptional regulator [Anaerolineales bacterium]